MTESCPHGHDIGDPASVYLWTGRRRCRACRRSGLSLEQAAVDPDPSNGPRRCTTCGDTKPLDEFPSNGNSGHRRECKPCWNAHPRNRSVSPLQAVRVVSWETWLDLDRLATVIADTDRGDWRQRAACRGMSGPERLFFPPSERGTQASQAKDICADCPVAYQCLAAGLAQSPALDYGIWGQTTVAERREIRHAVNPHADKVGAHR